MGSQPQNFFPEFFKEFEFTHFDTNYDFLYDTLFENTEFGSTKDAKNVQNIETEKKDSQPVLPCVKIPFTKNNQFLPAF